MFARRTESLDAAELEKLVNKDITHIFGRVNIIHTIEKSLLSVTITTGENEIIGFAAFYDYPRHLEKIRNTGMEWQDEYDLYVEASEADSLNSLFIHYFVAAKDREISVLTEIVNTVFSTAPEIHFIYLNTERGILPELFGDQFKHIPNASETENWFLLQRDTYMPRLYVRPARQEDNDDLTPIFNAQSEILAMMYGEFYIAEMINAQSDNMKCLVAEVDGKAIGFICVTKEGELDILNTGFYLEPFNGFRREKQSENDEKTDTETNLENSKHEEQLAQEDYQEKSEVSQEFSVPINQIEPGHQSSSESNTSVDDHAAAVPISTIGLAAELTAQDMLRVNYSDMSHFSYWRQKSINDSVVLPYYSGPSNALVIQLFAITEQYEMRSVDFLLSVFNLFPSRDYLIITVPHLVPEFTLLENFVRVTPRPGILLPHELYCFHRGSLSKDFKVRRACSSDTDGITKLLSNLNLSENILQDLEEYHSARRYNDGIGLYAYVAVCSDIIVGVAVLKHEKNIEYIRSHYNIEDFIYFTHHARHEHGHLKHFALNPIFKRQTKMFLKEIMRKSVLSSLYFPIYQPWANSQNIIDHSLVTCLPEMVPVRPRRQIQYPTAKLDKVNWPVDNVLIEEPDGYCLTHINRKLIMEPKVVINARIVVVGASTTGLSFLEYLCFCPHMKFNNLFLVSANGLLDDYEDDEHLLEITGTDFYFSKKMLEKSAIRISVTVIKGHMTLIDRKKKRITINRRHLLPYDHLILTTGLQYTVPCPIDFTAKTHKQPTNFNRRYSELVRKRVEIKVETVNLFVVNDAETGLKLLEFVRKEMVIDGYVIIYGCSFEAYCCIHTLLRMGIHGSRIYFVKSTPSEYNVNLPLNNPVIEAAVYKTLREASVNIYNNCTLARFNDSLEIPSYINHASFVTDGPVLRLPCKLFINYSHKVVNYDAFQAMNDACLVFDARLVIDTYFHTNDPCIRAAGPVTKYQRKFYFDQWTHARFNSKVIGEELAVTFLRLFDPTMEPLLAPPNEEVKLVPMYSDQPVVQSAILPGGYMYLHIAKPSLPVPLETLESDSNYGYVLITGSPYEENGYFRLHLNQYKKVETITCLRLQPYEVYNFIQLFDIHERALNNLKSRFDEGLITDLFDFFSDPWAIAFYHDRFKDLQVEMNELLMTRQNLCTSSFEEIVREAMADGNELSVEERENMIKKYNETGAKKTIDQRLLNFISYNYYHLPMYAKPDLV